MDDWHLMIPVSAMVRVGEKYCLENKLPTKSLTDVRDKFHE